MKKILVSYFFASDALPLGNSLLRGLRERGWDARPFECQTESRLNNIFFKRLRRLAKLFGLQVDLATKFGLDNETFRNHALLKTLEAERPDVFLALYGRDFSADTLAQAKQRGWVGKTVGWWVGEPQDTVEYLDQVSRYYDRFLSIHKRGYSEQSGIHAIDILAYDGEIYYPIAGLEKKHAVSFVGGANPRRMEIFPQLIDLPLEIWGPGWRKPRNGWHPALWKKVRGHGIYGEALNRLYNQTKIVLNVTGWEPASGRGLNLRILDVPATGAFLLTDYSDDLLQFFRPGVEIETWKSVEELRDKVNFYLKHDDAREKIAQAGLARVKKLGTYADKMAYLLAIIDEGNEAA